MKAQLPNQDKRTTRVRWITGGRIQVIRNDGACLSFLPEEWDRVIEQIRQVRIEDEDFDLETRKQ